MGREVSAMPTRVGLGCVSSPDWLSFGQLSAGVKVYHVACTVTGNSRCV